MGCLLSSSTDSTEVLFGFIILALIGITIFFFRYQVVSRRKKIEKNSSRLKELKRINSGYRFHMDVVREIPFERSLPNKRAYDTFDMEDLLIQVISEDKGRFQTIIDSLSDNNDLYIEYKKRVEAISKNNIGSDAKKAGVDYKAFVKYENWLLNANMIKPPLDITIKCLKYYISPQGKNRYHQIKEYHFSELKECYKRADRISVGRANVQHERAMMTDQLRYDIMKRDGFRCQLCGRSQADGVKLHVDHIKPVSKGGKTVPSNLRTLCEQCNLGKKDKYDPDGLN